MKYMIIGGKHTPASDGAVFQDLNPATLELIDEIPMATQEDVERALNFAQLGKEEWAATPIWKRIEIIRNFIDIYSERREELAQMLTAELGKPIKHSRIELYGSIEIMSNFCDIARTFGGETFVSNNYSWVNSDDMYFTIREPLGVIVCVVPFNFPVELYFQKVIPALLMGNAVIVKPSSDTPIVDIMITEWLLEAGVPANVLQIVTGSGSKMGRWLAASPKIDGFTLTGSTPVGIATAEACAGHLTHVELELGGNDACIALDDCDIDDAVNEAIAGRNYNSGQVCCSSKRFLVHNSIKEEFTRKLVDKVSAIVYGDPTKETTECGPLVNKKAVKENLEHIQRAIDQGAVLLCGGRSECDGRYFVPTVLGDVTPDMDIAKDTEVFAPVWPIIGFDTDEEAVKITNQTMYGLSCGINTKNMPRALRMAKKINTGGVALNGHGSFRTPELPFGGHKMTGIGQEGGKHTLESMSVLKTLYIRNK